MHSRENPQKLLSEVLTITRQLVQEPDLYAQLNLIVNTVKGYFGAEAGVVYLLDNTQKVLYPKLTMGNVFDQHINGLKRIDIEKNSKKKPPNVLAHCATRGELLTLEDIYQYSGYELEDFYFLDRLTHSKTKALLCIPLTNREGISSGVMVFFRFNATLALPLKPQDTAFLQGLAAMAAIAIANTHRIQEQNNRFNEQIAVNDNLVQENKALKAKLSNTLVLNQVVGNSNAMNKVYELIQRVSLTKVTVFINGETGTGKELIAQTIHANSPVRTGRFIAQNCAAFPPDLLESEMFGYQKGAFSGASSDKKGLFVSADNGTLFLDEIGEMPLSLQAKLLRVLQEGEIRPVGATETIKVDVRIIAATNRNLSDMVNEGKFREDLYYRLNVFPLTLPPLRERRDDIKLLVDYFIGKFCGKYGIEIQHTEPEVFAFLQQYAFPGNVRELMNILERAVILSGDAGVLSADFVRSAAQPVYAQKAQDTSELLAKTSHENLKQAVARFESEYIRIRLGKNAGNQTHTAKELGLSRRTLVEKLSKYNLRRMDTNPY